MNQRDILSKRLTGNNFVGQLPQMNIVDKQEISTPIDYMFDAFPNSQTHLEEATNFDNQKQERKKVVRDSGGKFAKQKGKPERSHKQQREWGKDHKFIAFLGIQKCSSPSARKQFLVKFIYEVKGKKHSATVRFGDNRKKFFYQHHDPTLRRASLVRAKQSTSPFKASFWELWLLDSSNTIQEGEYEFKKQFHVL